MYEELVKRLRNLSGTDNIAEFDEAADAIEALSKMEKATQWIPVTERLPNENDDVLIYGEWTGASGTKYREIWLTDLKGFLHQGYKPVAWMPLPEPPKEE